MRGLITGLVLFVWASGVLAGGSSLQSLDTTNEGRMWQAVGRIDINGKGFCTGALIAPDLVLTAAHCLFDKATGRRVDPSKIEFLAGWRNGRAAAYRLVRRAVAHPEYVYNQEVSSERVRNDVALLKLQSPIRNTTVTPFQTESHPRKGGEVGVVSYAHDRADAPSLQQVCAVLARQQGVLVMSCDVDFGSSGAPVFSFESGAPRIVSVVSAKADVDGQSVALGTSLQGSLDQLHAALDSGKGFAIAAGPGATRITVGGARNKTGAKFIKP